MSSLPAVALAAVPGRRQATLELAQEIERRGFSGIYCASVGDAMGLCHALALATNTITFGTTIVNMYTRHAVDYAQSASFIHETSGGRFRFGVGVSHGPMNDSLGLDTGRPLADTRNFVETARGAKRIGELPPIVLAALRDKMMALSAEVADGVVFANVSRSTTKAALDRMKAAHPVADDFFVGAMIPTCISDDREAAAAINRRTLKFYLGLPNYRNYWKAAGYTEEMEAIETALDAGDRDALPGLMTDRWLADMTLYGSAQEVDKGFPMSATVRDSYDFGIQLADEPVVLMEDDVLTESECQQIIRVSRTELMPIDSGSDEMGVEHAGRSGNGCWLPHSQSAGMRTALERVAGLVGIPLSNADSLQVIRYGEGEDYEPHTDAYDLSTERGERCTAQGGQRLVTAKLYLNTPESGGATDFPELGIEIPAIAGRVAIFHNTVGTSTDVDHRSLHGSLPVVTGEKWVANLWFRQERVQKNVAGRPRTKGAPVGRGGAGKKKNKNRKGPEGVAPEESLARPEDVSTTAAPAR
ncbi:putative prolyl 4-hydroxylase [Nymphon striatum]|nr:putative prolyl 4-hydroxylase [Nymphon striatum]